MYYSQSLALVLSRSFRLLSSLHVSSRAMPMAHRPRFGFCTLCTVSASCSPFLIYLQRKLGLYYFCYMYVACFHKLLFLSTESSHSSRRSPRIACSQPTAEYASSDYIQRCVVCHSICICVRAAWAPGTQRERLADVQRRGGHCHARTDCMMSGSGM